VKAKFTAPIQIEPGAHPTPYTMGIELFLRGKAAGAWP